MPTYKDKVWVYSADYSDQHSTIHWPYPVCSQSNLSLTSFLSLWWQHIVENWRYCIGLQHLLQRSEPFHHTTSKILWKKMFGTDVNILIIKWRVLQIKLSQPPFNMVLISHSIMLRVIIICFNRAGFFSSKRWKLTSQWASCISLAQP